MGVIFDSVLNALCPTFVSQSCVPPKNQHFRHKKNLDKQGVILGMVDVARLELATFTMST